MPSCARGRPRRSPPCRRPRTAFLQRHFDLEGLAAVAHVGRDSCIAAWPANCWSSRSQRRRAARKRRPHRRRSRHRGRPPCRSSVRMKSFLMSATRPPSALTTPGRAASARAACRARGPGSSPASGRRRRTAAGRSRACRRRSGRRACSPRRYMPEMAMRMIASAVCSSPAEAAGQRADGGAAPAARRGGTRHSRGGWPKKPQTAKASVMVGCVPPRP